MNTVKRLLWDSPDTSGSEKNAHIVTEQILWGLASGLVDLFIRESRLSSMSFETNGELGLQVTTLTQLNSTPLNSTLQTSG